MIGRIIRAVISIVIGIVPLLYLAGYFSFLYHYGLPPPAQLFNLGSATGGNPGSSSSSPYNYYSLFGASGIVPFGAFGITGFIAYTVLTRMGSTLSSVAAPRPSMPNFGNVGMFNPAMMMNQTSQANVPEKLPADITVSQFMILRQYSKGMNNSKIIGKALSMDKKDVEKESKVLLANGYLTNKNKVTSKAMGLLY